MRPLWPIRSALRSLTLPRGLIVTGGHVDHDLLLRLLKNKYDHIIAVDGGMNPFWVLHAKPDILLGDFDSCEQHALSHFRTLEVPEVRFRADKDMTDTDLAIEHMIEAGMDQADILGASGSRLDHTLANVMLLFKYADRIKLTMLDKTNKLQVASLVQVIRPEGYKYLSLIPISEKAENITLTGVTYPLNKATLERESSFAVSNEIQGDEALLSFDRGKLLVLQSND